MSHAAAAVVPAAKGGGAVDLWVFGGRTGGGLSDELWAFDVQSFSWRQIEAEGMPPEPREHHTLTRVLTRFLFAFGGLTLGDSGQPVPCDSVSLFDLSTSTWSAHDPYPSLPRIGHVAGYAAGCLYVFGGTDGNEPNAELHVFDCDALFPQTAALAFDMDPTKGAQRSCLEPASSLPRACLEPASKLR